jgi:hypothetical protein
MNIIPNNNDEIIINPPSVQFIGMQAKVRIHNFPIIINILKSDPKF